MSTASHLLECAYESSCDFFCEKKLVADYTRERLLSSVTLHMYH